MVVTVNLVTNRQQSDRLMVYFDKMFSRQLGSNLGFVKPFDQTKIDRDIYRDLYVHYQLSIVRAYITCA